METRRPQGGVFSHNYIFSHIYNCIHTDIFFHTDITVYQHGKNVLYFFYNIAQRTLTEEWWEIFRVDIELYNFPC